MKDIKSTQEFSKAEAVMFLSECKLLEETIKILKQRAQETLDKPHLKLVEIKNDQ